MHMVVYLLVQKTAQNNSIKSELGEALYVALKEAPREFNFKKHEKIAKKIEEKDAFDVTVDGPLDSAIKGAPLNLKVRSLCILYILYSAEQTLLSTFSNRIHR